MLNKRKGLHKDVSVCVYVLVFTLSSFSMRVRREGMSWDCKLLSSVHQAAKAGMNTWWVALTTLSDGSPRDNSISSKPCYIAIYKKQTYIRKH